MADFTFKANTQFFEERYVTWTEMGLDSPNLTVVPAAAWSWGYNGFGRLGLGDTTNRSSPVQIGSLTDWKDISVSGQGHTLAIKNDGTVWGWGLGTYGQLGNFSTVHRSSPTQIVSGSWKQVAAGTSHSIALAMDGSIWGWGRNSEAQLGVGNRTNRSSPTQISGFANWKQIAAGGDHCAAVKNDNTLWLWGWGASGQLGFGSSGAYAYKLSPSQLAGTNWKQVACGQAHTMAVKTDGTLWTWGRNTWGQLGNNTTSDIQSPIQVGSLTTWSQVFSGSQSQNVFAIKTDGTLWAWGRSTNGLIGNGTSGGAYAGFSSPVQVGSLTDWRRISGGASHVIATKNNGTLWAWGANPFGGLGTGNTTYTSSPVQIGTDTNWKTAGAGGNFSVGIKTV